MEHAEDDLHTLVHSLNPAEKRHFSRFAKRHVIGDANNYEALFQALLRMSAYDAEALETERARLGIQTSLAAAKNHLKTTLLRAMRDYNAGRDTHTRLLEGLGNLAFLHEKKLYGPLQKEIRRLKKVAALHAEHAILLMIGDYERRHYKETAHRDLAQGMEEILNEMRATAHDFQNQMEFTHLLDRMFLVARRGGADRDQAIDAILAHPLLAAQGQATTIYGRMYYHQIHAIAQQLRGRLPQAHAAYARVVAIWNDSPHLIAESPSTYRRILGNFLGISHLIGDHRDFPGILARIRATPSRLLADEMEIFHIADHFELIWRMGTHDWAGIEALLPALKAGLEKYAPLMDQARVLAIQYNVVIFHFLSDNHAACNGWLQEIMRTSRTEQHLDIQRLARILQLLLTYTRGDIDLLEYQHRSVQRYLDRWGGTPVETAALDFVANVLDGQETEALHAFADRLGHDDLHGRPAVTELRAWIQSKRTNRLPREELALRT